MTIYIDITQLNRGRANTGIQRVVKEFLQRAVSNQEKIRYKILTYNIDTNTLELLDIDEVKAFLADVTNFIFTKNIPIDILSIQSTKTTIFFEIDALWNTPLKRADLYPLLKNKGFLIFNYIYDLVPIIMPQYAHEETVKNFSSFLMATYKHSDMVFFDSASAQHDYMSYKKSLGITRNIPTRVTGLGSDFLQTKKEIIDPTIVNLLQKKYILFVGTIEPRKNQADTLQAFEILANKYPDLNLIFIGRQGWKVDAFINKINTHPLKDKQLYWLNNIDDDTLNHFYKNAFIVTYLSKYEGYGLPIAESLNHTNITIASKNSSMYEVGRDFADYLTFNSQNELVDIISLYCDNINLYNQKKAYIKQNYKPTSWDAMANSIIDVFLNYDKSIALKQHHQKKLQFVFISIELENIQHTIIAIDKYVDFVKEYIIITAPKFIKEFKLLQTTKKITIIDETSILGDYAIDFHKKDHQSKNWLLRASLVNLNILDDEFVMLDDDNRPLKPITIEKFINKDGSYNCYYFYNLLEWNHKDTEYDIGQQNMKSVLSNEKYELLSYSSHAPQIINKAIFQEAVNKFFNIGLTMAIDEWSIYFNYAASLYPSTFNKQVFQTLNWPNNPSDWESLYLPQEISFENYYKEVYESKFFNESNTYEEKLALKQKQIEPFLKSSEMFKQNLPLLSAQNLVHGVVPFKNEEVELYFSSIPYTIVVAKNSNKRLKLNCKLLNLQDKELEIEVIVLLHNKIRNVESLSPLSKEPYQEFLIEVPIVSFGLEDGIYDIAFDIKVNGKYIYSKNSPYLIKLIVNDENVLYTQPIQSKIKEPKSLKQLLKSIPFLGWFIRWSYNLLRLNNIKHTVFMQQNQLNQHKVQINQQQAQRNQQQAQINQQQAQINQQQAQINQQQAQINQQQAQRNQQQAQINQQQAQIKVEQAHIETLLKHNHQHHENYKKVKDTIRLHVNQQITSQSILFHQRIEKFIEEVRDTIAKSEDLQILKDNISSFCLDDYYLAFEETFRGSQELILQRYEEYLKYLNPTIKTALDIGCGRGEWTGLLQSNSIDAYGIDLNFAMLNEGLSRGIKNLQKMDVFDYFKSCEDNSFDLVTAFHIIEHIPFEKLFVFLQEIKRVSKPNATILLETPNPANPLVAYFEFYKDPTHLNPLPSDVVKFMVEYIGFKDVKVDFLHIHPTNKLPQDYLVIAKNAKQSFPKPNQKPTMCFLSPIPPQQSGIADYSAQLLPYLFKYYDIDLVVGADDIKLLDYPTRTIQWFQSNYNHYDRIIYHFGNSQYHIYMISLLEQIPGIIVLHDFYLNDLLIHAKLLTKDKLYQEHGYQALLKKTNEYPCNKSILNNALSVIVHSNYPKQLASKWYTNSSFLNWSVIPLLKPAINKANLLTKEQLHLPNEAFVVCSFGLITKNKKVDQIIEAYKNSSLYQDKNCYLVFVGAKDISQEILSESNIYSTDYTDFNTYQSYLNIANLAIQLRSNSRGETSAALLDCLNAGIATIANANGSTAELPKDVIYMLEDQFETVELTKALETLYTDKHKSQILSQNAKNYITEFHNPEKCALSYKDAIEKAYAATKTHLNPFGDDFKLNSIDQQVKTLALSTFDELKQKQILVDVSSIVKNDLKTGIQRVVRSQLIELIKNAPDNYRIEPVYLSENAEAEYHYARSYTAKLLNLENFDIKDEPVTLNNGDILYGLDLNVKEVSKCLKSGLYKKYKDLGVKISFVVYDLLPITRAEFFPPSSKQIHESWLNDITEVADKLIAISDAVAKDIFSWLEQNKPARLSDLKVATLHLGADILHNTSSSHDITLPKKTTFLMVGTIEPRKGHAQTLQSFEILWKSNIDVILVIVGKKGWMVDEFIQKLTTHPELNKRLFFLEEIDDSSLQQVYELSNCLIAPSQAEGFGLPLIEAAQHKLPIIARDIPVFREVASTYAYYFKDTTDPKVLALSIKEWLSLYENNTHPHSDKMPYMLWKQNAQKTLEALK